MATGADMITDSLAKEAFLTAMLHLENSWRGDTAARLPMHQAACMAGMAFSSGGLGLCHGMSHGLGGLLHISHGRLNAILLPAVLEQNLPAAGRKYADLARLAGLSGAADTLAVKNLKNALCRLRKHLGLPGTLKEAGADLTLLHQKKNDLIRAVLEDPCCESNPAPVTEQMIVTVLEEVTGLG